MAGPLAALYNRCVDALSFGADYQKLRRLLNERIDSPVSIEAMPPSHPAGFVRGMKKRRISIVESYLVIIRYLESDQHCERTAALRPFIDGLTANQESRIASIRALIENFKAVPLPALNAGWEPGSMYVLPALDLARLDEIVPLENLHRMHLGELLYSRRKPVLLRRVLVAKSKVNHARAELARGVIWRWDLSNIDARDRALRKTYTELKPESLRAQYFAAPKLSECPTVFTDMERVCRPFRRTGGEIKIVHPARARPGRPLRGDPGQFPVDRPRRSLQHVRQHQPVGGRHAALRAVREVPGAPFLAAGVRRHTGAYVPPEAEAGPWALMLIDVLERQFLAFREWLSRQKSAADRLTPRAARRSGP